MERPDPTQWRRRPHAPAPGTVLGELSAIPDGQAREFVFGPEHTAFRMLVVRRGKLAFGYLNLCPHFSLPLNTRPDRFMTADGTRLMCTQHLALFRVEDGYCEDGACTGRFLDPVPLRVVNDKLEIAA